MLSHIVDAFWPIFITMKAKQDVTDFMAKLELKKQVSWPGNCRSVSQGKPIASDHE